MLKLNKIMKEWVKNARSNSWRYDRYECVIQIKDVLDKLSIGTVDLNQAKEFICSLIKDHDEKGFWALLPSPKVDATCNWVASCLFKIQQHSSNLARLV